MRKIKGRMVGLFLKVEKKENLVVSRTDKLEDVPAGEISQLFEGESTWKKNEDG